MLLPICVSVFFMYEEPTVTKIMKIMSTNKLCVEREKEKIESHKLVKREVCFYEECNALLPLTE